MTDRGIQSSPQTYARIGGLLYVFIIVAASFGELFVRNKLMVWGAPDATANNSLASETVFRAGLASESARISFDSVLGSGSHARPIATVPHRDGRAQTVFLWTEGCSNEMIPSWPSWYLLRGQLQVDG